MSHRAKRSWRTAFDRRVVDRRLGDPWERAAVRPIVGVDEGKHSNGGDLRGERADVRSQVMCREQVREMVVRQVQRSR